MKSVGEMLPGLNRKWWLGILNSGLVNSLISGSKKSSIFCDESINEDSLFTHALHAVSDIFDSRHIGQKINTSRLWLQPYFLCPKADLTYTIKC